MVVPDRFHCIRIFSCIVPEHVILVFRAWNFLCYFHIFDTTVSQNGKKTRKIPSSGVYVFLSHCGQKSISPFFLFMHTVSFVDLVHQLYLSGVLNPKIAAKMTAIQNGCHPRWLPTV